MSNLSYHEVTRTVTNSNRIIENFLKEISPGEQVSVVMANLKDLCPYSDGEQVKIYNECVLGHMHNTKPVKRLKQMTLLLEV